jgi:phosphodiesterase/alkaline phosphatase D-like protein
MKTIVSALLALLLLGAMALAQNSSYSPYNSDGTSKASSQTITNGPVAETVSDNSAFIGWSTKDPASDTAVRYGTSRDHLTQTADATDTASGKNHHARLENLAPNTTYYFQVTANGQEQGGIGTFKTVGMGDKPIQSKAIISQK